MTIKEMLDNAMREDVRTMTFNADELATINAALLVCYTMAKDEKIREEIAPVLTRILDELGKH